MKKSGGEKIVENDATFLAVFQVACGYIPLTYDDLESSLAVLIS